MLLDAIVEQVIRAISGGLDTADGRFDGSYIEDKIHQYRIRQLIDTYNGSKFQAKSKFIHYSYYQPLDLVLVEADQDRTLNYITFPCPQPVNISQNVDGFSFVGNKKKGVSWSKVKSPEYISVLQRLGMMSETEIGYFYERGLLRVYGNLDIEIVHIEGIFQNPLEVQGFNPETDNYPMPDDAIPMMIENMKRMEFNQMVATPPDLIADGRDTITDATIRQNKR